LVALPQHGDPALEVAQVRARGEGARAHLRVLGLGALALAAGAVQLGQEVARLGGAVGLGMGGEVGVERLLVGRRERRIARARAVERAEAVVSGLARARRVGELAEEDREPLRRLARLARVQPAARIEEEDLRAEAGARAVVHPLARL